ncbi:MAG: 1-phosphofructokinase family hexose kinase [Caulobacterales bacterium]
MPAIATLTLNPAVDLSVSVDRVEPERKLRARDLRYDAGGGGINVARMVQRLGGETVAVFTAGGASGARLRALLAAEHTPCRVVAIAQETRQDFTARDQASGQQFRFVMPGPRLTSAEQSRALAELATLTPSPDILVASGSLPPGVAPGFYGRLSRHTRRLRHRLALDASGAELSAGLAAGVWLVKPNLRELEGHCGARLPDEASRVAACRTLVAAGAAKVVALSLGAQGALLVGADGAWRADPLDVTPVSAVGAGDSFMAGLVWALAAGRRPPDALRWAVAAASATLLAPGTHLGRRADVRQLAPSVRVRGL